MIDFCMGNLDKLRADLSYRRIFEIFCENGDRTASQYDLEDDIKKISFADYEYVVRYVADKLIEILKDKPRNSFVGLKLDNCPEWPAYFWGMMMAGYCPFLIDYRHGEQLTEFFLKETEAAALITTKKENVPDGVILIETDSILPIDGQTILDIIAKENPKGDMLSRVRQYNWSDEIALCTSGTTSTAKIYTYNGVAIANQVLTAEHIIKANQRVLSDEPAVSLQFLPLHHIFGFLAAYLWLSFFATTLVYIKERAPSVILSTCRKHRVTHIFAVPLLVNNVVNGVLKKVAKENFVKRIAFKAMCAISSLAQKINPEKGLKVAGALFKSIQNNLVGTDLRIIICGGGHVLPNTLSVINSIGYYTVCGFGMTEVGISSLELRKDLYRRNSGCVGIPVESVEYKLEPLDASNLDLGELYIRGNSIHSGMVSGGKRMPPSIDKDGWFATGDIGRLDNGALYIEGRIKEVIINESGENVYPDELEDYFNDLPGVSQFCVLGVPKDDVYEDIALVAEVSERRSGKDELDLIADRVRRINSSLPVFKKISSVFVTRKPLPLANGIKVKRQELKKMLIETPEEFEKLELRKQDKAS